MDYEAAAQSTGVVMLVLGLAMYVYLSLALMTMAKKSGTSNAWLAWIPILNVFLMLKIAMKPLWWFILLLIPFVNIVISILVYMGMAKRMGKPEWVGVLVLIPVLNIFIPGYLAWSTTAPANPTTSI